ncbi:MAG: flagellar basal body rod protein FlgC [Gammaproteobacteria bacterium]
MGLNTIFDIAASGMSAQSIRMNTLSSNLANAESVSSNSNETYRAKHPIFSTAYTQALSPGYFFGDENGGAGQGVEVVDIIESQAPLQLRYQPDHPMADEAGYVAYPNVNVVEEMADMISASRSFQNNVDVLDTAKTLLSRVITLGQR